MMDIEPTTPTKQGSEKEKEKQKEKRDKGDEILSADLKKKEQQDFSGLVEAKLPEYTALALEGGKLPEALELLMALEKQTRQGGDDASTAKVACCIVRVCYEAKDWLALNESLVTLSKRRGQSKKAVQQMVQEAMTFVEAITDMPIKLDLIKTLRNITEGKIFVEIERAKLTRTLAYIKEAAGEISDAADLLQEVQVETYGSMEPRDKIDYILEQVRLCLAKQDFVRAHIISNKIAASAINKEEFQDLKLRYHELMIQYYSHKKDYLNICRAYRAMYDTKCIKEGDKEKWKQLLRLIVVYAVLAPYANDQFDIMHRINADKNLLELPKYRALLKYFITMELVRWPKFEEEYRDILNQLPVFAGEGGQQLWKDLHARVVEHNIRVVAEYYQRITAQRFAQLLDLSEAETERFISDMVSSGLVRCKIDRPKGIVTFTRNKNANDVLNDWAHNVGELLGLVEKTCHLIHRENMVYGL